MTGQTIYSNKKQMKKALLLIVIILSVVYHTEAQQRKAVVRKGKKGRKTVIRKGPHKTVVVHKTPRKRVKRTRVVHHRYINLPRRGAVVASVNTAAITVRFRGVGFRVYSGVWYKPKGTKWIVARAPIGARVRVIPKGFRKVIVGSNNYFYHYGTYYMQKGTEYEVVETPTGAEIDSLPNGSETVIINGETYYLLDSTYYMPSVDNDGNEILIAVANPN